MGYGKERYFHLPFSNVFVDELSVWIGTVSVGCCIGDTCMNHIIYADDTALLAPSPAALQKLLDIAAQFINEKELVACGAKRGFAGLSGALRG